MASRYARDANKALNAQHAEILRGMLKEPHNRMCGDCKRNDARWASTNLGVFMCIRCSGIHRGMGVHISRIKSVDLDTWTPEQIANVQRWGNQRANAYWEAHLREGHIPADHKIESFIRSKYESRRWVLSPEVPEPETLGPAGASSSPAAAAPAPPSQTSPSARQPPSASLLSRPTGSTASVSLLDGPPSSTSATQRAQAPSAPAPAPAAAPASNGAGLFDLDFSIEGQAAAQQQHQAAQRKGTKNDILSLFSQPPPPRPVIGQTAPNAGTGLAGGLAGLSLGGSAASQAQMTDPWGAPTQQSTQTRQTGGDDLWGNFGQQSAGATSAGTGSSAWGSFGAPASAASVGQSVASPGSGTTDLFNTTAAWGSSGGALAAGGAAPAAAAAKDSDPFGAFGSFGGGTSGTASAAGNAGATVKKDDAFGDIWGDWK